MEDKGEFLLGFVAFFIFCLVCALPIALNIDHQEIPLHPGSFVVAWTIVTGIVMAGLALCIGFCWGFARDW